MDKREETRQQILATSRAIISTSGLRALTFDAVARALGISKQAVIYWFPKKQDLLRALIVPWIKAEATAVTEALREVQTAGEAIEAAVRALVEFHLADLDRFRQIYLCIQVDPQPSRLVPRADLLEEVHPVTDGMYSALEGALMNDPAFRDRLSARRTAMSVHTATLGLLMMTGLSTAIEDPLAHTTEDLVTTLTALLQHGAVSAKPDRAEINPD